MYLLCQRCCCEAAEDSNRCLSTAGLISGALKDLCYRRGLASPGIVCLLIPSPRYLWKIGMNNWKWFLVDTTELSANGGEINECGRDETTPAPCANTHRDFQFVNLNWICFAPGVDKSFEMGKRHGSGRNTALSLNVKCVKAWCRGIKVLSAHQQIAFLNWINILSWIVFNKNANFL